MTISPSVRSLWLAVVVLTLVVLTLPASSFAQVSVAIRIGPPALPVYEQPPCPGEGYLWTPGYWAYDYDSADYYWVPGTWVLAPEPGLLWTPGYWGWGGDRFIFHEGYWGPHVGFYGGIAYGFGYTGVGYQGGRWDNGRFFYNRSVNNVNVTNVHNVYNTTVINQTTVNRVSYNGGNGGVTARPSAAEEVAQRDRHIQRVAVQTQHEQAARTDRQQRASVNQGRPTVAATAKPADFRDRPVAAKEAGAPYHPPANRGEGAARDNGPAARQPNNVPRPGAEDNSSRPKENGAPRPANKIHPNDLPARERSAAPNTGNPRLDKKYQQQDDKLGARQDKERLKLQQRQDQEHQKMLRQKAGDDRNQQVEQRHQQQTEKLEQKQAQQQQRIQEKRQATGRNEPKPPQPR